MLRLSPLPEKVGARLLAGVVLAGTLAVLDSTIVVPLLTAIGTDLGAGTDVSWLVSAYLLASTVTIPVWGRLLDLHGERAAMRWSLLLFVVGTAVACAAPDLGLLIGARVVQGVGAGGLVPLGQAILVSRCTAEERARVQVYYNVAYGLAAGLGPLVGGFVVGISWRWAFVVILPFGAAVAVLLRGQLHRHPTAGGLLPPFDVRGSVLITAGLVGILLAVERTLWWPAALGFVLLAGFAVNVRRHPRGLIPKRVLGDRIIQAGAMVALLIGFVQFAYLTYLPALSLQKAPELNSGLVVLPLTVLWLVLGTVSGMAALRRGTRPLLLVSAVAATLAGLLVAASPALPALFGAAALVGTAAGLSLIPTLLMAQHRSRPEDMGATTSTMVLFRNFGGSLGVAAAGVLLAEDGRTATFLILAAVAAAMVLPTLTLPDGRTEARMREEVEHGGAAG